MKKHSLFSVILSLVICAALLIAPVSSAFAVGSGTEDDPFVLDSIEVVNVSLDADAAWLGEFYVWYAPADGTLTMKLDSYDQLPFICMGTDPYDLPMMEDLEAAYTYDLAEGDAFYMYIAGDAEGIAINLTMAGEFVADAGELPPTGDEELNFNVYTFNALDDVASVVADPTADKVAVPEGTVFADGFFTVIGEVTQRYQEGKGGIYAIEIQKNLRGALEFTVNGAADVILSVSSTGGNNTSAVALVNADGVVIENVEGLSLVSGTSATELTYIGLPAGTYQIVSPEHEEYKRGFRLMAVEVVEVIAGEPEVPDVPDVGNGPSAELIEKLNGKYRVDMMMEGLYVLEFIPDFEGDPTGTLIIEDNNTGDVSGTYTYVAGDYDAIYVYDGAGELTEILISWTMDGINLQFQCPGLRWAQVLFPVEEGGEEPGEGGSGTMFDPYIIPEMPYTITGAAEADIYYVWTAPEAGVLHIDYVSGQPMVSGLLNWDVDENGNYLAYVEAGEEVSINPWGSPVDFELSLYFVAGEGGEEPGVSIDPSALEEVVLDAPGFHDASWDPVLYKYTATEAGSLTASFSGMMLTMADATIVMYVYDNDSNMVSMICSPNYMSDVSIDVLPGDIVIISISGGTLQASFSFAAEGGEEPGPDVGGAGTSADNPIIIPEMPATIANGAGSDLYYQWTAPADGVLTITVVAGTPWVSGLANFEKDDQGNYIVTVTAGEIVSINPWGSAEDYELSLTFSEGLPEEEVEILEDLSSVYVELASGDSKTFKWIAPSAGKLTVSLSNYSWNGTYLFVATVNGQAFNYGAVELEVAEGDEVIFYFEAYGYAGDGNLTFSGELVAGGEGPDVGGDALDEAAQAELFNGKYVVDFWGTILAEVTFDYANRTVSVVDNSGRNLTGTYTFEYVDGALVLTNADGIVVENVVNLTAENTLIFANVESFALVKDEGGEEPGPGDEPGEETDNSVLIGLLNGKYNVNFIMDGLYQLIFTPNAEDPSSGILEIVDNNSGAYTGTYTYTVNADGSITILNAEGIESDIYLSLGMDGASLTFQCTGLMMPQTLVPVQDQGGDEPGPGDEPGDNENIPDEEGNITIDWAEGSWLGYEGTFTAPEAGEIIFTIVTSNVDASRLTFRVIDAEGNWYNQYEFELDADGNQIIKLTVEEGELLTLVAFDDYGALAGDLVINVSYAGQGSEPNPPSGDVNILAAVLVAMMSVTALVVVSKKKVA